MMRFWNLLYNLTLKFYYQSPNFNRIFRPRLLFLMFKNKTLIVKKLTLWSFIHNYAKIIILFLFNKLIIKYEFLQMNLSCFKITNSLTVWSIQLKYICFYLIHVKLIFVISHVPHSFQDKFLNYNLTVFREIVGLFLLNKDNLQHLL